jgi:hypothetical protein
MSSMRKVLLTGVAALFLVTGTAHAKAIFQCGPFKFALEQDDKSNDWGKGWKLTWIAGPIGDEIYIDGHLCRPTE